MLLDGLHPASGCLEVGVANGTRHQVQRLADAHKYGILRRPDQRQMKRLIVIREIAPLPKACARSLNNRTQSREIGGRSPLGCQSAVDDLTSSASCRTRASTLGSEIAGRT